MIGLHEREANDGIDRNVGTCRGHQQCGVALPCPIGQVEEESDFELRSNRSSVGRHDSRKHNGRILLEGVDLRDTLRVAFGHQSEEVKVPHG